MKALLLTLTAILFVSATLADNITDPVHEYAKLHNLFGGRVIYKWALALNNDGKMEMLLATKLTPEELEQARKEQNWDPQVPNERNFTVYIPNDGGAGYFKCKGVETDVGILFVAASVDITQCFVGNITQMKRWGLVSVSIEPAGRRNAASATIYAYTLEGDHLKETVLAKYDPHKGVDPIYNQYLSASKRTKIQLQEIAP